MKTSQKQGVSDSISPLPDISVDSLVTSTFLANLSGISIRQVGVVLRDASVQRTGVGRFPLAKATLALFAYERAKAKSDSEDDDARGRLLATKAKLEELKLARELAQTITVDAVLDEMSPVIGNLRAQLLTVAKKVAPILKDGMTAGEREAIVTRAINDALKELATLPTRLRDISPAEDATEEGNPDE